MKGVIKMMGDDMAIRSGGMYGNPESAYTLAKSVSGGSSWAGGAGFMGSAVKAVWNIAGSIGKNWAEREQISEDLSNLRKEKEYNLKNFRQTIADTFAQNKMSFYSSGLDLTGSAQDVIQNNKYALQQDMNIMAENYYQKERSLKEKQKALRGNLIGDIASSVLSIF